MYNLAAKYRRDVIDVVALETPDGCTGVSFHTDSRSLILPERVSKLVSALL